MSSIKGSSTTGDLTDLRERDISLKLVSHTCPNVGFTVSYLKINALTVSLSG